MRRPMGMPILILILIVIVIVIVIVIEGSDIFQFKHG